jgi:hypothetical protein
VTEAGGPTRPSKVVVMSVEQKLEQVCAGGWKTHVRTRVSLRLQNAFCKLKELHSTGI